MTGTDLTEQLYTPRGSQGLAVGSFVARDVGAYDPTTSKNHPN